MDTRKIYLVLKTIIYEIFSISNIYDNYIHLIESSLIYNILFINTEQIVTITLSYFIA